MNEPQSTRVDVTAEMTVARSNVVPRTAVSLSQYQLLAQLSSGKDATAFQARELGTDSVVEVRLLRNAASVAKRLRLAAMISSLSARMINAMELTGDTPFIVHSWTNAKPLAARWSSERPTVEIALSAAIQLARLLAACHELGLAVGNLNADSILEYGSGKLLVEVTGIDAGKSHIISKSNVGTISEDIYADSYPERNPDSVEQDVHEFAMLLGWLLTGDGNADSAAVVTAIRNGLFAHTTQCREPLHQLALAHSNALAADPSQRPSIHTFVDIIEHFPNEQSTGDNVTKLTTDSLGQRFGRFMVMKELGRGGMGTVYLAEDMSDGTKAAIKVLNSETQRDATAIARFRREARLLSEIASPYVARLLDVNVSHGLHYLAMEFVSGLDLGQVLKIHRQLPERLALQISADVARALTEAHARGIVHRDIKPGNIILSGVDLNQLPAERDGGQWQVKVVDFGLARRSHQSESMNVTRTDAFVGTPAYMAPEQTLGNSTVDGRADIYSLGCTLYEMLCGRPPFDSPDVMTLVFKHSYEEPKPARDINPEISDGAERILEKCLSKKQEGRFANGRELLVELERQLRGEPTHVHAHPILPDHDPKNVVNCDWRWELTAPSQQLWPQVSNTERLNRAVGLPPVNYSTEVHPQLGVQRFGQIRLAGQTVRWQELPYEWIEGRRMAVLRQFQYGPFEWFLSRVELTPRPDGGTTLRHQIQVMPRSWLGRVIAFFAIEKNSFRSLDRNYRRMDSILAQQAGDPKPADPFEAPLVLRRAQRRRLDSRMEQLVSRGVTLSLGEQLSDFLMQSAAQEIARIRPVALAERFRVEPVLMVETCLLAVREGLLLLRWDILCPSCRVASEIKDTLRAIRQHGHCAACNLDFDVDWSSSVEMIFQVHPDIREADLRTYCIGGPQHFPHVVAQVRIQPGELLELEVNLSIGEYAIRGPQLPRAIPISVQATRGVTRTEIRLPGRGSDPEILLRAGPQWLAIFSETQHELLVRLERAAPRRDAFTAAQASALAVFRELFPAEVLSEGQLATVARLTFVSLRYCGLPKLYADRGDAATFSVLQMIQREVSQIVRNHQGTQVSEDHRGQLAVFQELTGGFEAGLALAENKTFREHGVDMCAGVHHGPALVMTRDNHIDYFGSNVDMARQLVEMGSSREVLLSRLVAADPLVAALLRKRNLETQVVPIPDFLSEMALRIRLK